MAQARYEDGDLAAQGAAGAGRVYVHPLAPLPTRPRRELAPIPHLGTASKRFL